MVVGIVLYKFEMGLTESGEIEPEFKLISSELTGELREQHKEDGDFVSSLIKNDDLFSIYYNHTAGIMAAKAKKDEEDENPIDNSITVRLKKTPYNVVSFFHEIMQNQHYMTIALFKPDNEIELFEHLLKFLSRQIGSILNKIKQTDAKMKEIEFSMKKDIMLELKQIMYQMDRLSNLTKIQKVALVYTGEERIKALELLREGPISRIFLRKQLEEIKENPNLDLILKPLIGLNLVRRDWAQGVQDRKAGIFWGEGEYIFLIKDILLVRKPPETTIDAIKRNSHIVDKYLERSSEFFRTYDPFKDYKHESRILAKTLLNPDIYDFLAFIKNKPMKRKKIPNIMSSFSESDEVISFLVDIGILASIFDGNEEEWICLLCEISPLVVFPEYLVGKIQEKMLRKNEKITEDQKFTRITPEIAHRALSLLETTYNEEIEF